MKFLGEAHLCKSKLFIIVSCTVVLEQLFNFIDFVCITCSGTKISQYNSALPTFCGNFRRLEAVYSRDYKREIFLAYLVIIL